MEAAKGMPIWLDMFLAILAAFGGLEFLKWIASLDIFRRKGKAEAKKEEAQAKQEDTTAAQQQADLVSTQIETSKQMLEQMKQHNEYQANLLKTYEEEKLEDRKIKQELRLEVFEVKRQMRGLQDAFTQEVSKRKAAERLYCSDEKCKTRRPPLGTYSSDSSPATLATAECRRRDANGRFVKKQG
ncbi:MAG: hypothetical protein IKX67_07095 [Bacteroidales bacterium]|nr:hypothetical protein [Bacteroidales bacterium]